MRFIMKGVVNLKIQICAFNMDSPL
uniref:DNA-directed RNA polymerase I largest subunit, putative n=1 Tax=Arundo donax TaxID=35708 RepID=A0A0A9EJY9_ARUDO